MKLVIKRKKDRALKKFFIYELELIYGMQKYLDIGFPIMIKAASSEEIKAILIAHQSMSLKQIIRLEAIFESLSLMPKAKHPEVMKKIIREVKILIKRTKLDDNIRDAALILTGREIDHYAIAAYAGLIRLSTSLNLNKVSQSLYMAMEDEMNADSILRDVTRSNFYSITVDLKPVG